MVGGGGWGERGDAQVVDNRLMVGGLNCFNCSIGPFNLLIDNNN